MDVVIIWQDPPGPAAGQDAARQSAGGQDADYIDQQQLLGPQVEIDIK